MMARNGTFAKLESNHLEYRRNDMIPKGDRNHLNNRSSVATAGRNNTSIHTSTYNRDARQQMKTPSNGQHLVQNISLSIDDLADMEEKPEIVNEGELNHQEENDVMNDIENEYIAGDGDPSPLAKHDFLVSFLVDARGGSMYGCRNSGIKVIIPPKTASQPMRITCRYVKSDNIRYPPVLNDNEGLACRILKVGPTGSRFLGNVQIEVPYVASLKEGQREIVILKCDSVSKNKWVEHHQDEEIIGEPSHDNSTHRGDIDNDTDDVDKMLKEDMNNHCNMSSTSSTAPMSTPSPSPRREDVTGTVFGAGAYLTPGVWSVPGPGSHSSHSPIPPGQLSTLPPVHPVSPHHHINQYNRSHLERPHKVVRIFTSSFPQYFAIITRTTQEIYDVGPEQRTIELSSVPNTKINIKAKSILKNVNIGLSAQNVDDDLVEEIMAQGGSVSPIVTIEPRRRKFHKAIKVSIPLPPKCLAKKKSVRGAQCNGGDDESVIVTQLSPALKRAGKKGDTPQKKSKGNVSISLNSQNAATSKTTPKKSGKETPTSKQAESDDESSQIETSLRLVCSMSGNHSRAVWEDVTDTTPMTIHLHDPNDADDENQAETSAMIEYDTTGQGTPSRQRAKVKRRPKSSESPRSAKSSFSMSSSPGYVEFTTLVSASFWLVHCPNWMRADMLQLVDQIYKNTNRVPYFCRFHIYARRGILSHVLPEHSTDALTSSPKVLPNKSLSSSKSNVQSMSSSSSSSSYSSTSSNAVSSRPQNKSKNVSRKSLPVEEYKQLAHLRILCLSEQDRAVHPLELQEDFVEICRTDDFVEIRDKSEIEVRFSGNLVCLDEDEFDLLRSSCVTSSGPDHITELTSSLSEDLFTNIDSHKMVFKPFDDNRMGFAVKRKNEKNLFAKGSISFVTSTAGDKVLYETKLDLSQFM